MADPEGKATKSSLFKASPFGAPAPTASLSDDDDDDDDFFSRSKHTYALLAAEEEQRKKRKTEEAKFAEVEPSTSPSSKKQKTGDTSDKDNVLSENDFQVPSESSNNHQGTTASKPRRQSYGQESNGNAGDTAFDSSSRAQQSNDGVERHEVIDLGDDDSLSSSIEEVTAAEFPESSQELVTQGLNVGTDFNDKLSIEDRDDGTAPETESDVPAAPLPDEGRQSSSGPAGSRIISLLITSAIPETSSLVIQRKLGQRLKEVRLEWSDRQGFDRLKSMDVVLTWRGKQVYDSTSCLGLGIGVNAAGNIVDEGEVDLVDDSDGRIHMEAMTRQMLKEMKEGKTKLGASQTTPPPEEAPPVPEAEKVRLILKSKGRNDVKLKVKESHTISRLINAFRQDQKLDESDYITVYFDGEELEPNATIASADINNMDTLDVYVKE